MNLRDWMRSKGVERAEMASRLRVSVEAVRLWMNGDRIPNPNAMRQISKATSGAVTANDFYNLPKREAAQ